MERQIAWHSHNTVGYRLRDTRQSSDVTLSMC